MNPEVATGRDLDAIAASYGVLRLPRETDANFRARLIAHIAALHRREWGL